MSVELIPLILISISAICMILALSVVLKRRQAERNSKPRGNRMELKSVLESRMESEQATQTSLKTEETRPAKPSQSYSISKILNLPPPPKSRALSDVPVQETDQLIQTSIVRKYEDYFRDIAQFQESVSKSLSAGEVFNKTCRALAALTHQGRSIFLEYQATQKTLMVTSRSTPNVFVGTQPRMFLPQIPNTDLRQVFEKLKEDAELQKLLRDASSLESAGSEDKKSARWNVFPLLVRGVPQGAFALQESPHSQNKELSKLANLLVSQAAMALENIRLHSRVLEVSSRDSATGLQTRKYFQERMQQEFLIARRLRHPLTLLRLEVDHMGLHVKQQGSQVSDAILRHVTRHLERCFRKSDILARYSKEGFAIVLPHTALVDALKKTESLIQTLQASQLKINLDGGREALLRVSLSAGLVEFPSHAENSMELIKLADEAVHQGQARTQGSSSIARVPSGYIPPFNSRFVRSAPKGLHDKVTSPILDS